MKKLILTMAAVSALAFASSSFAYAEDTVTYVINDDANANYVKADAAAGKSTVCIYKETTTDITPNDIVYIGEAESPDGFSAATCFLLNNNATAGTYVIKFGGDAAGSTFEITDSVIAAGDTLMTNIGEAQNTDGTFNIGFTCALDLSVLTEYKSILVKNGDTTLGYGFEPNTTLSGSGKVSFGIQLNKVTAEQKQNGIEVYLSTRSFDMTNQVISGEVQ
ncbi:MAG: hypothetical protein PUD92_01970 [Clostridiales bacterium]|nr:hypothetical protein [Clostridiales bacterium]